MRPPRPSAQFVFPPHGYMTGIVIIDADVWVEGCVDADLKCRTVVVAPEAKLDGVVVADCIEVYGHLEGETYTNRLIIRRNSYVAGELNYAHLELEEGAYFEGRSRRYDDPLGYAPDFTASASKHSRVFSVSG